MDKVMEVAKKIVDWMRLYQSMETLVLTFIYSKSCTITFQRFWSSNIRVKDWGGSLDSLEILINGGYKCVMVIAMPCYDE